MLNYEILGLAKKYRTWELKYYIVGFRNSPMSCADPEEGGGGQGVRTPLKNHKNVGFLSNTGPDPLKNHKVA